MSNPLPPPDRRSDAAAIAARSAQILASIHADPQNWALFLDLDGSLIDLAARPDAVVMPQELAPALERMWQRHGGALAVITGRPRAFAQAFLGVPQIEVIGLHGAEGLGGPIAPLGERAKTLMRTEARRYGLVYEDKGQAAALHYRSAPAFAAQALAVMRAAQDLAGTEFALRHGKCVIELAPSGADKGQALRGLMQQAAFRGRRPLAVGDDVTDEAMFGAARALGGFGLRIGADLEGSCAELILPSPEAFRLWIKRSVS